MTLDRAALDRYLTTPPDNGFDNWCEQVDESFELEFFEANTEWILDSIQCENWLNDLHCKDVEPKRASQIIERAFNIYVKNKKS
jgi:hypothetical protein